MFSKMIRTSIFMMLSSTCLYAFTLHGFGPSFHNPTDISSMDAALGITGYTIEDFENSTMTPELTITTNDPSTGSVTLSGSTEGNNFSNTFTTWGSSHVIYPVVFAKDHTFSIEGGTSSFGLGIAEIDDRGTPHAVLVNGQDVFPGVTLESLPGFVRSDSRNIYIRIDADNGELIESVTIRTLTGGGESTFFSHLAFESASTTVPEPSSLICFFLGSFFFFIKRKKAK